MKPSKRKPKKKSKPVVRFRRVAGLLAPTSAVKRKISEIGQPRCSYIFPEHGHGHQQCTRPHGHYGAHWCGWKGKQS